MAFIVVALLGTAAVALTASAERRNLAFTLGVPSQGVSIILRPGHVACQTPIPVSGAFDEIELSPGTYGRPGSSLDVVVKRVAGGPPLGHGTLAEGYADTSRQRVSIGRVETSGDVAVCIRNTGASEVGLFGASDAAARKSSASLDGEPQHTDLRLVFLRHDASSTLGAIPRILGHASLFRFGWVGPWLYWLLLGAVLVAVPVLIAAALSSAASDVAGNRGRDDEDSQP